MQFKNCTAAHLYLALEAVNRQYQDNLLFKGMPLAADSLDVKYHETGTFNVTLRTTRGGVLGSRNSATGRRINAASWEAHRDFLWALFDLNPYACVSSWMTRYNGRHEFLERFPATGDTVVGTRANPLTIRDLTFHPQ